MVIIKKAKPRENNKKGRTRRCLLPKADVIYCFVWSDIGCDWLNNNDQINQYMYRYCPSDGKVRRMWLTEYCTKLTDTKYNEQTCTINPPLCVVETFGYAGCLEANMLDIVATITDPAVVGPVKCRDNCTAAGSRYVYGV